MSERSICCARTWHTTAAVEWKCVRDINTPRAPLRGKKHPRPCFVRRHPMVYSSHAHIRELRSLSPAPTKAPLCVWQRRSPPPTHISYPRHATIGHEGAWKTMRWTVPKQHLHHRSARPAALHSAPTWGTNMGHLDGGRPPGAPSLFPLPALTHAFLVSLTPLPLRDASSSLFPPLRCLSCAWTTAAWTTT